MSNILSFMSKSIYIVLKNTHNPGGKLCQREGPSKLNAFCPNEDLTGGRLSWRVEEE